MIWKPCSGIGQPAMSSQEDPWPWPNQAMCPVCTKYLQVKIGDPCPPHRSVVIDSKPTEHQREVRR
jgi:hypothetical protein